ncbi:hypothetical protein MMC13_003665 [Lambiella insularis]|nr:hypothetical protein [Lambiella insularis]
MSEPFSFRKLIRRKGNISADKGKAGEIVAAIPVPESLEEKRTHEKYGLFLLHGGSTADASRYNIDVVAVHGLGGNAYTTWTNGNGKLWLRDFLPDDMPGARIFTYGYNSAFAFSRETGTLREYARALLEDIRCERSLPEERNRPLVFVCHSMGGLIVKQALLIGKNESDLYPEFNLSVSGILFLGAPHQGSPSATYATILSQIANVFVTGSQASRLVGPIRTELLHSLETNAEELLHIAQDFRVHTGKLVIASFIEQKSMRGLNQRIVDEKSGFMGVPTERLVPMPDCDHREICKPGAKGSNYKKLLVAIRDGAPASSSLDQCSQGKIESSATIQIPDQHVSRDSVISPSSAVPDKGNDSSQPPRKSYIRHGWTILHTVAEKNDTSSVQRVIASGLDPSASTVEEGWTPLWLAAHYGCYEVVKVLLAAGVKVDATALDGSTPLFRAAVLGADLVVRKLLEHGASVEGSELTELGTPLTIAALRGHVDTVKVLLGNGASCQARRPDGYTALHCALGSKHQQVAEVLLDAGHPVNVTTSTGLAPIHIAIIHGNTDLVRKMLDLQANVNQANDSGFTPVRLAVQVRNVDIVKMLLARGARHDTRPEDGLSLIEVALMTKDVDMCLFLTKQSSVFPVCSSSPVTKKCGCLQSLAQVTVGGKFIRQLNLGSLVRLRQTAASRPCLRACQKPPNCQTHLKRRTTNPILPSASPSPPPPWHHGNSLSPLSPPSPDLSSSFHTSTLHQRDARSSLFSNYSGDTRPRPAPAAPSGSSYGYSGASGSSDGGSFRPATPNRKGQYSDAVLDELESQNEAQVQGMTAKVRLLKDLTVAIGEEITASAKLAERMNETFEGTRVRLRGTMGRMLRMAERTGVGWRVWVGFFAAVICLFWYVWLF